jgi:hypothetical protein
LCGSPGSRVSMFCKAIKKRLPNVRSNLYYAARLPA